MALMEYSQLYDGVDEFQRRRVARLEGIGYTPLSSSYSRGDVIEKEPYDVLDLKALRCFWATGRLGSLTRAGIELGISEAAISQRIKSLEKYLGTKLYESRGGKIRLTAAGQHTLDMAIVLFDELQDFEGVVAEQTETETLTLSAHDAVLRYFLSDILIEFTKRHPLTRIRLLNRRFSETVQLVQSNDVDLGIIPQHRVSEDLVFHPLQTYKVYLILARGHPLLRDGLPQIKDLSVNHGRRGWPRSQPGAGGTSRSGLAV